LFLVIGNTTNIIISKTPKLGWINFYNLAAAFMLFKVLLFSITKTKTKFYLLNPLSLTYSLDLIATNNTQLLGFMLYIKESLTIIFLVLILYFVLIGCLYILKTFFV
jgi:hypothetical protein